MKLCNFWIITGVPVSLKLFVGCYYGFEQICPNAEISKKALRFLMTEYEHAVDHNFAEVIKTRWKVVSMSLSKRARQLLTDIPAVFLCLKSHDSPLAAKILAGITVVYALSPIDLIPDFIPVIGYLDDLIILPALIALTIRSIPQRTLEQYRKEAEGMWQNGKPQKWYFAIPIVLIWLIVISVVVKFLFF
jgi:uncharacterized membrane protein YkvA (DUF1232 family)